MLAVAAHDGLTADMFHIHAVCPYCRKEFFATDDWGYRAGARLFCSYTCMQTWMKGSHGRIPDLNRRNMNRKKPVRVSDEERNEIRRLNTEEHLGPTQIAVQIHRAPALVSRILKKMLTDGEIEEMHCQYRLVTQSEREQIVEMYKAGVPGWEISKRIGRSLDSVYDTLHGAGIWKFPDRMTFQGN